MTDWQASLDEAVQAAENAVTDVPDAHDAWRIANQATDTFKAAWTRVTKLRGRAAKRIQEQDELTLRGLGEAIGKSHVYADKIIKEAER